MKDNTKRWLIGFLCALALTLIFVYQRTDLASLMGVQGNLNRFLVNRTIRFLLNDMFALGFIYAIFHKRKFLLFALWVQVAGVILFLLPYFVIKIYYPEYNGPLISFLHRLVVNPTLLILLIPAFWYQERVSRNDAGG